MIKKIPHLRPTSALETHLRHKGLWLISLFPWYLSYLSAPLSQLDPCAQKGKWRSNRVAEASIGVHLV